MANDVHIKITADKADTSGIKDANAEVDKLKDSATKATPAIDGMTKAVGNSGKSLSETDKRLAKLNDSIAISKDKLASLAKQFVDTNDSAQKIDISKAMQKVQSDLNLATKAKKLLIEAEPHVSPGKLKQVTSSITSELQMAARTASQSFPQIIGAGILATAPLVGSALAGAIIGGAGIGGVVGGIMLVKDDPRVVGAAQGMASRVGDELKDSAKPFVDTTVKGIATIETSLNRIDFEGIFRKASTFVQPLATAAGHMAEDFAGGFGDLIQVADPVIKSISHGLTEIGAAAKDGMDSLTDNADEAAVSLGTLLDTVKTTTTVTFGLINGLTELKAKFDEAAGGIFAFDSGLRIVNAIFDNSNGTKWVDPVDAFNNAITNGVTTVDSYGQAITTAGMSMSDLASQTLDAANASRSLFDTETSTQEALDNLSDSIKQNGKTLDSNTEKGRANRTALSHLAGALNAQYEATLAVNGAGAQADKVASSNYGSFVKAARGLGIGKEAAEAYARKLGLIPPKRDTKINANTHDAQGRLDAIQDRINSIHGKTVSVHVSVTGTERLDALGHRIGGYKASGGIVGASANGSSPRGLTWVGENGPELADLNAGTRVWSAGDSARMAGQQSSTNGGTQIIIKIDPHADPLMRQILEALRFEVRGSGGVVQTVLS